jgi:hypothetical protein
MIPKSIKPQSVYGVVSLVGAMALAFVAAIPQGGDAKVRHHGKFERPGNHPGGTAAACGSVKPSSSPGVVTTDARRHSTAA